MTDTEIPKKTKKMLLFVSIENPMWAALLKTASQNHVADFIRVAHGTIPSWKNGGGISENTAASIFSEFRKKLANNQRIEVGARDRMLDVFESFVSNYGDDNRGVYATAEMLSIPLETCQRLIDEVIYRRAPVFPGMYYDTKRAANEYFQQYQGVFSAWLRRGDIWIQSSLRVRYVIEIGSGFAIRCKLNVPLVDPEPHLTYWEYDGFLIRRPNKIFWMFEKRQRDRNDHLYFVTCIGRLHKMVSAPDRKNRTLLGTYLTTDQSPFQTIVSDDILLQRIEDEDITLMRELMHAPAAVLNEEAFAWVNRLHSDFRQSSK